MIEPCPCEDTAQAGGGFFQNLASTDFVPRAQCIGDRPEIIWLHVVSDVVIAISYLSIPLALLYFVRQRKDLQFKWMFVMFAAFITACGTTHLFNIQAMWHPMYRLDGLVKAFTGVISAVTACGLVWLLPKALKLPSPAQLGEANKKLAAEVEERRSVEQQLRALSEELNRRVEDRTAELCNQNQKLVRLTERAHRFVDDVSHEFRTPLTVIKEFAAIIGDGLGGPVTKDQAQYLDIIDNAVADLNQMVEDFLDSSKLRAGRLRVDRRSQQVEAIFARIRPTLLKKAASKSITLIERAQPDLPAVYADEEKVRRIIMNIATNALKFSPEGTSVVLWARRGAKGAVEIGVTDQGPGLTPADRARLFDRFCKLPSSDEPNFKSFGLGLNIARQLVWLNLGGMGVTSEPGQGATFFFTLPVHEPRVIVESFLNRLAECEEQTRGIAIIRVSPEQETDSLETLHRFLAATTRPTDVVLEMPRRLGRGLIALGPTTEPSRWIERLLQCRQDAVAREGAGQPGPVRVELIGSFVYPAEASATLECALEHLTLEHPVPS